MWKLLSIVVFITYLLNVARCSRHMIYWDQEITPTLNKREGLVIDVRMNEWMDILCPHYQNVPYNPGHYLRVYNVTKHDFDKCHTNETDRVLICQDPRKESKLTTKFQRISPSPLGFVFKPGHTYYYISRPLHDKERGCHGDIMKLTVRVSHKSHDRKNTGVQTYHVIKTNHGQNNTKKQTDKADENTSKKPGSRLVSKNPHHFRPKYHQPTKLETTLQEKQKPAQVARQQSQGKGGNSATRNNSFNLLTTTAITLICYYILKSNYI